MSDERPGKRTDFDDLQNEIAGRDAGRITRFLPPSERGDIYGEKPKSKAGWAERTLSELQRYLEDPAYKAAWERASHAIDVAQQALDAALEDNARRIADLEDRAAKLPDGRAVFIRPDGQGETADGEIIPLSVMDALDIPDDAPTIDDYNEARERRRELGEHAETIDDARREANDPNTPPSLDRLEEIEKDMKDLTRAIEDTYNPQAEFNAVAAPKPLELAETLDFSKTPTPPG